MGEDKILVSNKRSVTDLVLCSESISSRYHEIAWRPRSRGLLGVNLAKVVTAQGVLVPGADDKIPDSCVPKPGTLGFWKVFRLLFGVKVCPVYFSAHPVLVRIYGMKSGIFIPDPSRSNIFFGLPTIEHYYCYLG